MNRFGYRPPFSRSALALLDLKDFPQRHHASLVREAMRTGRVHSVSSAGDWLTVKVLGRHHMALYQKACALVDQK